MGEATGVITLVVFDGYDIMAIYYCCDTDNYEAEIKDRLKELEADEAAYLRWEYCYNKSNVWMASEVDKIDKYDEDGNEIDLEEHPWTLQELYEDMTNYSFFLYPYYVTVTAKGKERNVGEFYKLENAVSFARELDRKGIRGIDVRQYAHDIEEPNWDGCTEHDSFEWKEPIRLDGRKVRIVFDDGEVEDIFGEITFAEENRIHIVTNLS